MVIEVVTIIFLLFASFFFSGSETALSSSNRIRLQTKAINGDKKSEKLLRLVSKPSEFITSILIGNNIANIILPTLVTALAIKYGFNVGIATVILTVVIIIFAEIIPKSVAAAFPESIANLVYPIISAIIFIFKPITYLINKLTDFITGVLSKDEPEQVSVSKEELRAIIDIADSEGMLQKDESYRMKGALDFRNLNVKDVLKTPRVEIESLEHSNTYEEVKAIILKHPFSRYPVYEGGIDNIIGVFHSKHFIHWSESPEKKLVDFTDEPLIAYEFHSVQWIFRQMTIEKKHMAVVLDEYGGTEGILTHEDVIETMIGLEIEDETDIEGHQLIQKLTDNEIICDGKITLHQLNSIFGTDIPEDEDVLAAYLLRAFNNFPEEDDVIVDGNLTFKIIKVVGRTIDKVQIIK